MHATHHAPNVKAYLAVFAALLLLTIVTVSVSYLRLPIAVAVFVALVVATVKAGLVAAFFMHLKGERVLIYGLLGLTAVFLAFLFLMPMWDISYLAGDNLQREHVAMEGHPAPHVP